MDEQERVDKRSQGMFYRGPTMGAKCSYQNPELGYIRVDLAKVDSRTLHVRFEDGLY